MSETTLLAIDPGPAQSAAVWLNGESIQMAVIYPNDDLLESIRCDGVFNKPPEHLVIEMIASYGMPVGKEVFETCVWIGRFIEAFNGQNHSLIYRKDVKVHLCGSMKAKDGNIRQALIDRLGPIGTKKNPGPCYGISKDMWSALAVALTWRDKQ